MEDKLNKKDSVELFNETLEYLQDVCTESELKILEQMRDELAEYHNIGSMDDLKNAIAYRAFYGNEKELDHKSYMIHSYMAKTDVDKEIRKRGLEIYHLYEEKKLVIYFQYDGTSFIPGYYKFDKEWTRWAYVCFKIIDVSKDEEYEDELSNNDKSEYMVQAAIYDRADDVLMGTFHIPLDDFLRPDWKEYLETFIDQGLKELEEKENEEKQKKEEECKKREYEEYLKLKEKYETKNLEE